MNSFRICFPHFPLSHWLSVFNRSLDSRRIPPLDLVSSYLIHVSVLHPNRCHSPSFTVVQHEETGQNSKAHSGDNLQPGISIWDLTRQWSLSFFTCEDVKCLVMFSRRWATCEEDTPHFYRCQRDLMYLKE